MSAKKTHWTAEEIMSIAAEIGVPITRGMTVSSMYCLPEGLDRSQIATSLRYLWAQSEKDFITDPAED